MPVTPRSRCAAPCKVVVGYMVAACTWIFLGDWVIFKLWPEKSQVFNLGLAKGLGFIVFSSAMLYLLLRKNANLAFKAEQAQTANQVLPLSITKIFSATPVIIYSLEYRDGRSTAIWVSNNIGKILGYSEEEALSIDWWKNNLHPDDHKKAIAESQKFLNHGGGSHEYRFRRTDGSYLYAKDDLQLIDQDREGTKLFIGVWTDLSDNHRAQLEIKAYAARIEDAMYNTINMIAELTELRDPYTAGHEARVGELAATIAAEMGYDSEFQQGLRVAGLLHDVGKIGIPSEILIRPRQLQTAQYELLKTHAEYSYLLVRNIVFPWPIAQTVYQHHERLDGSGYPRGLKADEIILEARILAIADVVESMSSHRPYRPAIGLEQALMEIEKNAGKLYDATAARACLMLFREKGYELLDVGKPNRTFSTITAARARHQGTDPTETTTS